MFDPVRRQKTDESTVKSLSASIRMSHPGSQAAAGKKGKAPDVVGRISHLYRAAHAILTADPVPKRPGSAVRRVLSTHYSSLAVGVARKAVFRPSQGLKRTLCPGCRSVLLPEHGVEARHRSKKKAFILICGRCRSSRTFPLKKSKKHGRGDVTDAAPAK